MHSSPGEQAYLRIVVACMESKTRGFSFDRRFRLSCVSTEPLFPCTLRAAIYHRVNSNITSDTVYRHIFTVHHCTDTVTYTCIYCLPSQLHASIPSIVTSVSFIIAWILSCRHRRPSGLRRADRVSPYGLMWSTCGSHDLL